MLFNRIHNELDPRDYDALIGAKQELLSSYRQISKAVSRIIMSLKTCMRYQICAGVFLFAVTKQDQVKQMALLLMDGGCSDSIRIYTYFKERIYTA